MLTNPADAFTMQPKASAVKALEIQLLSTYTIYIFTIECGLYSTRVGRYQRMVGWKSEKFVELMGSLWMSLPGSRYLPTYYFYCQAALLVSGFKMDAG